MKKTAIIIALTITAISCRGPLSKPGESNKGAEMTMTGSEQQATPGKVALEKQDIKVEPAKGCISIADLYAGTARYSGQTVRVKGRITKVNPAIMGRNWIHLQDGTEYKGQFDLTVTTDQQFTVGTEVIVEGKISLDKDFGYGYKYNVLMEEGKPVK